VKGSLDVERRDLDRTSTSAPGGTSATTNVARHRRPLRAAIRQPPPPPPLLGFDHVRRPAGEKPRLETKQRDGAERRQRGSIR
jgi:hypothetical protein